jgi:hypothetical protein
MCKRPQFIASDSNERNISNANRLVKRFQIRHGVAFGIDAGGHMKQCFVKTELRNNKRR